MCVCGGRISNLFVRGVFVQGFDFRSSNFVFDKLFVPCSKFELILVKSHDFQFFKSPAGGVDFEKTVCLFCL